MKGGMSITSAVNVCGEEGGAEGFSSSAEARAVVAWTMGLVFDFVLKYKNHIWSYDFVHDQTRNGQAFLDAHDPG